MKIAFFELEGWEGPFIEKTLPDHEIIESKEKIDEHNLPERTDIEILSIFVNSKITQKVLNHLPRLKLITTRSTGFDHISLDECKKHSVMTAYVPGYGNNTVAEFAFGLILNLTRKLYPAIHQMKEDGSFSLKGFRGIDIKGKTIGILGTGRIGKEMIHIAQGFGMNVMAFDVYPDEHYGKNHNFIYAPLEKVLKHADIISIHLPLTNKTKHIINKRNIGFIKRGAYLVNTARGGIVETDALVEALQNGILAGVGLDVLEEEGEIKDEMLFMREGNQKPIHLKTLVQNHILMKLPNVLITPHNAFNTQEALERILNTTLENIKGFIENKPINTIPS